MTRIKSGSLAVAALSACLLGFAPAGAQEASPTGLISLTGGWRLDRQHSQFPSEIGFGVDWLAGASESGSASGGGRRGSGGIAPNPFGALPESEDDAARVEMFTAEVRQPSAHVTIADTPSAVTITDDHGRTRTIDPDGREQTLSFGGVPVPVTAKREAGRLEILYDVEDKREVRYVYSRVASPPELIVDTQFLDHGKGQTIRRVYQPAAPGELEAAAVSATAPASAPASSASASPSPATSGGAAARQPVNQRPDAALGGLTELNVAINGAGSEAGACGLQASALEAAVTKHLTDAGLKVSRYSTHDTYLNVDLSTTHLSTGLCVSRYDVSLDSETTATLAYQHQPVPVQASLLHGGGLAGGSAQGHAADVLKGVLAYVDQFAARIRQAGK